jgi:hypothetical protein
VCGQRDLQKRVNYKEGCLCGGLAWGVTWLLRRNLARISVSTQAGIAGIDVRMAGLMRFRMARN